MKTKYIAQLEDGIQEKIKNELTYLGFSQEDIERAMDSRLCDLEDTINSKLYQELIK